MSVRSADPRPIPHVRYNRLAAIGAWLLGVLFTYLALLRLAPALGVLAAIVLAAGGQALLTLAQRPLWRWALGRNGGRFALFGAGMTFVDGLINAGGIYPYAPRLAKTDAGLMIIELFGLSPNVSTSAAAILALAFGVLIAGLPEYLWEMD